MTAALTRRPATPYARRLARERGFALTMITGTGPNGRIVAADVATFRPAPAVAVGNQSAAIAAFATQVDLSAARKMLADFGTNVTVDLDDLLIRAAALGLEAIAAVEDTPRELAIGWESGQATQRRVTILKNPHLGLVSTLHTRRVADTGGPEDASPPLGTALSIRRIAQSAIRPVSMPLLPGFSMRLVVGADGELATAECLLCFDASVVGEDRAAALLGHFRDGLQVPLRLLA